MPVETTLARDQYNTNGTTGPWAVSFYFLDEEDLSVTYTDDNGDETTLAYPADYSVTGAGDSGGGSITTTTAYASGGLITIVRAVEALQPFEFQDGDPFPADTANRGFDRLTMLAQRVLEIASRALVAPVSAGPLNPLPGSPADYDGYYLGVVAGQPGYLLAPTGTAGALAGDIATSTDSAKGGGQVGFGPSLGYVAKTMGAALQDHIPSLMWFVSSEVERAAIKAETSTTDYTTTLTNALALCPRILIPEGKWNFSSDVSLADSQSIIGLGVYGKSIMQFASGKGIILPSTSGRNEIMGLDIRGTSNTGSGIKVGDTSFSGKHRIVFNRISGFDRGIELAGALYTYIQHNWIIGNLRGIDFKAGGGSLFSTTVWIEHNDISDNTTGGVTASNVPIRNQVINYAHNAFERNASTTPGSTAQLTTGSVECLRIVHNYFEDKDAAHTTKPAGIDCTAASVGEIALNRFDEMRVGLTTGTGSVDYLDIHHNRFLNTVTSDYVINGGVLVNAVKLWSNTYSAAQTLSATATNTYDYGATRFAPWAADETSFTPTLRGSSTAGTPTVTTAVGRYTDIGKRRFFEARVTISAIGGMTGNLQLSGLPGARATTTGLGSQVICQYDGVTLSAGRTELVGEIASGSSVVDLYQCGSGVATLALPISGVASATTIVVSGNYPIP